ncbi:hypothetical protein A3F06_03505 [candidate division TM6 bacterium RIFCSPHIGHO2_12_FULL_36_22]|nr:MAG: hypothetical protein A3F06_03505 [candidate division TM6 bacterium RIFCSPHIGHO2_12_FULL_36_22]
MTYSLYYQAEIPKQFGWYITAILRSHDHLAFDRTIDVQKNIFEFFISPDKEEEFLYFMQLMEQKGAALNVKKLPNRLKP